MDIVITALTTLLAVVIGARLTSGAETSSWLREKQLAAYLELIDALRDAVKTFAIGLRVSSLESEHAAEAGHDFEGVEDNWRASLDELELIESRITILGGRLDGVYEKTAHGLVLDMLDALDDDDATHEQWDALVSRGQNLIDRLEKVARDDLAVDKRHYASVAHLLRWAGRNVRG